MKKLLEFVKKLLGKSSSDSGFTLIELLVVIAILGVLAGALFVAINPAGKVKQANDAKAKSDITEVASAVEQYAGDPSRGNGGYPSALSTAVTSAPSDPDGSGTSYSYVYLPFNGTSACSSGNACTGFAYYSNLTTTAGQFYTYDSRNGRGCVTAAAPTISAAVTCL